VLGDAPPERFAQAVEIAQADAAVDAVLVMLTPQSMTDSTRTAELVAEVASRGTKPVLASWIGGLRVAEGAGRLQAAGIPCYETPEGAVEAFLHLVSFARNREILYELPRDLPIEFPAGGPNLAEATRLLAVTSEQTLTEDDSKQLLAAYGIPIIEAHPARTVDEAVALAGQAGYPVVLKIWSPDISHKTDVGGVRLGLRDADGVRAAYTELLTEVHKKRPSAQLWGVTVQPMANLSSGLELIVGLKTDPTFGAVLLVGGGGITAELAGDRALELPPLNERLARRMLESLRLWKQLNGYRGRPPLDVDALIEVLIRLSRLVARHPEIREFDINPLLVLPKGVLALDARVVVRPPRPAAAGLPYSHLAIRPYPEGFVREVTLENGQKILLRPIRPEDEPLWIALRDACSPETLRARFRHLSKRPTHESAARFCVLDYDRELAIVAEVVENGSRQWAGVAQLIADANHEAAEYAVLVADAWQGRGLGQKLTEFCVSIAAQWGVHQIVGETSSDNSRMQAIFGQFGFAPVAGADAQLATYTRTITPPETSPPAS